MNNRSAQHPRRPVMKEHANHEQAPAPCHASLNNEVVTIYFDDDQTGQWPLVWLRDHCPCDTCRHVHSHERLFSLLDADIGTPSLTLVPDMYQLTINWPDGHRSALDTGWLYQRRPGQHDFLPALPAARPWQLPFSPRRITHETLMAERDRGQGAGERQWLQALMRDGLVLLDQGPTTPDEVIRFATHIGPLRDTNFGARFDVVSKPTPNNAAYTALELELHIDLPNWHQPPDIQLLYCLENDAQGGGSTFADGYAVAEDLRIHAPEAFRRLADTPIDFRFQDSEQDITFRAPVIGVDHQDKVTEIRFNNWIRDALDLPLEEITLWYEAYLAFWQRLKNPLFRHELALAPGQMIAFDNRRVLHGRSAFNPETGRRHLQGCYLDRDMIHSRFRVLSRACEHTR
ncbi:TauD/TfdA family dioxygenase [Larsenimonas rhizosphaerae]|uniref:TauD/TfdA family dioxygenase n=1 Tax=Larsenimonas rhizosphaerae TaxID=2944682 RepID=UPI0020345EDB|nr:TauD/TfdA family dioxygenase [Larsenimonas rhizosphaerae]MCM2129950.1 TauD/TfdA family dioxygenase [Larsenimonas rhizosphaerae]